MFIDRQLFIFYALSLLSSLIFPIHSSIQSLAQGKYILTYLQARDASPSILFDNRAAMHTRKIYELIGIFYLLRLLNYLYWLILPHKENLLIIQS